MKQYTSPCIIAAGSVMALTRLDVAEPDQEFGSLLLPGNPVVTI